MKVEQFVELVKEYPQGLFHERSIVVPEKVDELIQTDKRAAWYVTPFNAHGPITDPSKDFERLPKSADLYFDFDGLGANEDAKSVYQHLTKNLQVPEAAIKLYHSGSKGYHLIVQWETLGIPPRVDLHDLYRRFAQGLASSEVCKHGTLDTKIYQPRRILRIVGTVHQKTGALKTRVSLPSLTPLNAPETRELGLEVAEHLHKAIVDLETDQRLKESVSLKLPHEFLLEPLDCVTEALTNGLPEGSRNEGMYTLALYFRSLGLTKDETRLRLESSGLVSQSGVDPKEIKTTITSAYNSENRFGLKDSVLTPLVTMRDRERWKGAKLDEEYETLNDVAEAVLRGFNKKTTQVAKYYVQTLDDRIGGINSGELIVLGGTTGTGKSEFALHVARKNAESGVPSAFVSLELSNQDVVKRLIAPGSGVENKKFWGGDIEGEDLAKVKAEVERIQALNIPLFFRRKKTMMTVEELDSMVSKLILERQCRFIVIDHLHFFTGKYASEKENAHVAQTIMAINGIAIKYGVGIMCIAHFKKQQDNMHKPTHHEFRDSSSIEQTAHTILLMWRNQDGIGKEQSLTEFRLTKSRKDLQLQTMTVQYDKATREYNTV